MSQRRGQRWGCGTWMVVLLLLGLSIEYWYVTVPVLAVLIVTGLAVSSRRERQHPSTAGPTLGATQDAELKAPPRRVEGSKAGPSHDTVARRYRPRCDWCGAPRWRDADACRYCGRSLLLW